MFRRILVVFTSLFFSLMLLAGCNTMEGFGEDVEQAGDEIEEATN